MTNTASSNVFLTRYDTTGSFTSPASYTVVDFTQTFNSNVTGVYQTLSTGTELIMLPQGTPGKLYTYQLNANVQSQWYTLDYSTYGNQITEGVLIGNSVYFVSNGFDIIKYSESNFTLYSTKGYFVIGNGGGYHIYSANNGTSWNVPSKQLSIGYEDGTTYAAFGNDGVVVVVGQPNIQAYSENNGSVWKFSSNSLNGNWESAAYGNGVFVIVGSGYHNQGIRLITESRGISQPLSFLEFGLVSHLETVFLLWLDNKESILTSLHALTSVDKCIQPITE